MFTKKIKTLFFPFLLLLLIGLISIESNAQDVGCVVTPPGAECGEWATFEREINLASLGAPYNINCPIWVSYSNRICTVINGQCTTRIVQYKINRYWWSDDADEQSPCFLMNDYILPGYPQIIALDNGHVSKVVNDINKAIADINFMIYFTSLTPSQQQASPTRCSGSPPNCTVSGGCTTYEAHFSTALCRDICLEQTYTDFALIFGDCPSNPPICCSTVIKYCACFTPAPFNTFSGFVTSSTTTQGIGGTCSGNGPQYNVNCVFSTGVSRFYMPCRSLCPEDDQ